MAEMHKSIFSNAILGLDRSNLIYNWVSSVYDNDNDNDNDNEIDLF